MNTSIIRRQEDDSAELFSLIHIPWKQTEGEIWENFSNKINTPSIIVMKPNVIRWQLAAAAIIVLFISIGTFMSTFTTTKTALTAQHLMAQLPDGSSIELNAKSEISYKPYWWWANRQVKLQGEAYFEVKKGKIFSVKSNFGITEVLGTKFNIYSRNEKYEVTCISGKVKVKAFETEHSVILHPKQKASLQKTGQFKVEENVSIDNTKAWMSNKMVFTSASLKKVFKEIERQFNVEILIPKEINYKYTGSFDRNESIENILNLICRPFELNIEKESKKKYKISR